MALGLALVLQASGQSGAAAGMKWGLLLGLLIVLPAHSGKWTWQDKPMLLAIDTGGHLLSLLASGLILGSWAAPGSGKGADGEEQ